MTEILTESFCERCGTRYTFESAAPGQRRFTGLKVLGRGLKQFVLSDDATLDEAIAAARSDVERDATNHQLDAFHRTFSFCMSCRQYTCANCWNETEARCLSCAPLAIVESEPVADVEIDPERLLRFVGQAAEAHDSAAPEHGHPERDGVPTSDGAIAAATVDTDEDRANLDLESQATDAAASPDPGALSTDLGHLATGQTRGQSLDDAIAAYETSLGTRRRDVDTGEPATDATADMAYEFVADEARLDAEPAPAVVDERAAATTVEPSPAAPVEPSTAALVETDEAVEATAPAESRPAVPAVDSITQPVWPVSSKVPTVPPQWPTGPRWPTGVPAQSAPAQEPAPVDALAALMSHNATDAMWAASSREILQPVAAAPAAAAVQSCSSCGISLSATARFCRRCGTPQG